MSTLAQLETLWRDRRDLEWAVQPRAEVGYLGWLNRGNLGDEAMYSAHCRVASHAVRRVPLQSLGWRLAARGSVRTLVLGGGTLLARREWGARLARAIEILSPDHVVSLGVGVEDPEFALAKGLISEGELAEQVQLMHQFRRIGVRGPRSQATLAALGLESEVLGDPALVLGEGVEHRPSQGAVLLSLAQVTDGYAPEADQMRRTVAADAAALAAELGVPLRGLAMERKDREALRRAKPDLEFTPARNVQDVVDQIAVSSVVIGERLHANILAAALGRPFVALGYKPKTYDFVESVGAEDRLVDTREVSAGDVLQTALNAVKADQSAVAHRVAGLVASFKAAAEVELA